MPAQPARPTTPNASASGIAPCARQPDRRSRDRRLKGLEALAGGFDVASCQEFQGLQDGELGFGDRVAQIREIGLIEGNGRCQRLDAAFANRIRWMAVFLTGSQQALKFIDIDPPSRAA